MQLGGSSADEDGHYILGDDALACLRDLKRWLKLYDEKLNRLDVARCLAEAKLVAGDLLPIPRVMARRWQERQAEGESGIGMSGAVGAIDMAAGDRRRNDTESPQTHSISAAGSSAVQGWCNELGYMQHFETDGQNWTALYCPPTR